MWLKVSKNDLRKKVDFDMFYFIYTYIRKYRVLPKIWHFPILLFLGFLNHICSRKMVKSVEKRPSIKSGLWHLLPHIYIRQKNRVLPKIWHFPILLFLGFLTHICSRNMLKSVEKRPSKESGLIFFTLYIHT